MGAEEKNKNEILSRIVADLFANPTGGEDLSAKIHRLREEIKKVIENEDTIFGKFHGVTESFREIIPEEIQRYNAAIKALLATSKISRQEIVKAVNSQLEELKILEKILLGTPLGRRDELKALETKSREIRDEISKLREKTGRLESEEKEILNVMAAREKEMEPVEKAVREIFADIGAEISYIKKRVEGPTTGEYPVFQPVPPADSMKSAVPAEKTGGGEQKSDARESPAPQDTGSQKKCPMCGGRMDLQMNGEMWLCYSCAYEESGKGVQPKGEEKIELTNPTPAVSLASLSSNEHEEPIKGSIGGSSPSNTQPSTQKKACPACPGKMKWHESEKTWRCPYCGYERRI